jgi:hypothetical protein
MATGHFGCQLVDSDQRFTFNTNEPWAGTDEIGKTYRLSSHDIYTAGGVDPSPQSVATITFADNKRYLCFVKSVDPAIDVQFYHYPYSQLSLVDNVVTASDWDLYPISSQMNAIEGYTLNNEIDPVITIDPQPTDDGSGEAGGFGVDAPKRPYAVESWRPLVAEMAGDIPVEVLLRWIKHESGGNPCSTGKITDGVSIENGLFQLYSPDDDHFATPAQLHGSFCSGQTCVRDLTLDEARIQVASGIAYVRQCRNRARAQLQQGGVVWDEAGSDFWALVKMQHNLPSVPAKFIPKLHPSSWSEFKAGVLAEQPQYGSTTIFSNAEDIGSAAG